MNNFTSHSMPDLFVTIFFLSTAKFFFCRLNRFTNATANDKNNFFEIQYDLQFIWRNTLLTISFVIFVIIFLELINYFLRSL